MHHDVVQMILQAGPMVKFVLSVLLLFSVISWMIIYVKFRLFSKAARETETFMELFTEDTGLKGIYGAGKELTYSPIARLFVAGYAELIRIQKIQGASKSQPGQKNGGESLYFRSPKAIINNLERTLKKYGDRGRQYVYIETGHATQNILLEATALGLGAVPVGAFEDTRVQEVLGMGQEYVPLLLVPVGKLE